jgi:DNA ligase-1
MDMPLIERKQLLDEVIINQPHLSKLFYIPEKGIQLFEKIKQFDLEGQVAKHKDSRYYSNGKKSIRPKDIWYKIINWRYHICYIVGYRKDKNGWYIALPTDDGKFTNVGLMEFGASPEHKQAFYQIAKTIITKEMKDVVWIQPLIQCKVKHRGLLRSGNHMTPIFVEFII